MSQTLQLAYRRLILELGQAPADEATIRLAGEFARGLGLDLHGLFIEDEALLQLAALPFAREIRLPSHQWQAIDTHRLEAELRSAADAAHHRLQQVVADLGIPAAFEVVRGEPHLCIAGVCTPADILVIPAYDDALPRLAGVLRAAAATSASILLVPRHPVSRTGPVVAVAGDAEDPAVAIAARIAEAGNDSLVVVTPESGHALPTSKDHAAALGMAADRLTFRAAAGLHTEDVLKCLDGTRERLVVLTRKATSHLGIDDAARIARIRRIPVLAL